MTRLHRWVWTVTVTAAAAMFLATASPSWARQGPDGQRQGHARQMMAVPLDQVGGMMKTHQDAMARWAAMDGRIQLLMADVNMFTGELKVAAMAELLTAIVERQSAMMDEMWQMHGLITPSVTEYGAPDSSLAWPPEVPRRDEEPGMMCAPVF